MRLVRAFSGLLSLGLVAVACSSEYPGPNESVASTSEAITTACDINTIGLPCDPDGPTRPATECQGICAIVQTGSAMCIGIAEASLANLDGRVCGNAGGIGNAACARHCQGVSCLTTPALAGAACRPTSKSAPCDGQCNGAGTCTPIASPCDFGRDGQLCTFKSCNFVNATSCQTLGLLPRTNCDTGTACELGFCAGKVCTSGGARGCDDGNSCTDDSCDAQNGSCVGTPDDANTCSDGNACTVGDFCASGACKPGSTQVNCDDNDPCTIDGCDPKTGCTHGAKCSNGDACTITACDHEIGKCGSTTPLNCDDDDPCTVDACDSKTGCSHTPMNCDDSDACTTDSCAAGQCEHEAVSCPDPGPCASAFCVASFGCVRAPIPGCIAGGGSGGTSAGGEAGTSTGGTAGSGDSGGSGEIGGSAGEVDSGTAEAGTRSNGAAGAFAEGGTSVVAEDAGTMSSSKDTGGCGCRAAGSDSKHGYAALLLAALGLAVVRRRR